MGKRFSQRRKLWILLLFLLVFLNTTAFPEEKDNFKLEFSAKISGGLRYMNVGDLNTFLESFDNYLADHIYYYDGGKIGTINNYGYEFGGELRLDINSKLSLGIGIGYLSRNNKSDFQTVGDFPTGAIPTYNLNEFILESEVKTIPLRAGIYLTLPVLPRVNLVLNGGLDYFFSDVYLYKYHMFEDLRDDAILPVRRYDEYKVSSDFFGYHGSVGLEYNLWKNMFLVLEIKGMYAKSNNLKGSREYYYSWLANGTETGALYIGNMGSINFGYGTDCPALIISPTKPSGDEFGGIREFVLDFSGVSVTLGIRLRLF